VKHRLYQPETYGKEKRTAAQYTLYTAIYRILQLLAPISPHITEEIYQIMYADDQKHESIHVSPWPTLQEELVDEETEKRGDLVVAVMGEIRRDKAENQKPLNAPIKKLTLHSEDREKLRVLRQAEEDLVGTCKIGKIEFIPAKGEEREVEGYPDVRFRAEY
jgi:valyl-tRNA synthetase